MQILYPEIKPYKRHQFKVSELHELYVDEAGNSTGLPVLFVHGGPGTACDSSSRRFYDPAVYRIITFDQRGCGRSTPHGELTENTTQNLIADMEAIRQYLKIDKWVERSSRGSITGFCNGNEQEHEIACLISVMLLY